MSKKVIIDEINNVEIHPGGYVHARKPPIENDLPEGFHTFIVPNSKDFYGTPQSGFFRVFTYGSPNFWWYWAAWCPGTTNPQGRDAGPFPTAFIAHATARKTLGPPHEPDKGEL